MKSKCDNCNRLFHTAELPKVKDLDKRVSAGEPMPSGECPTCGALCHLFKEYTDTELIIMEFYAKAYIEAIKNYGPSGVDVDDWQSPWEGLDLHFQSNDDRESASFGQIEVWGYHRDKYKDGDCVDEVRII